jgi:hypothetical protein
VKLITSILLLLALACTGAGQNVGTMTGAFVSCAKADLGQIIATSGQPLLDDVAALIEGAPAALEADLSALVAIVGIDAVQCAIAAVAAVMAPKPPTATSTTAAAAPMPPGLVRALAWSAQQDKVKS